MDATTGLSPYVKKIQAKARPWVGAAQKAWWKRPQSSLMVDLSFTEMAARFPERNAMYAYALHYYANLLPPRLREHRVYFKRSQRGFGEDTFHAMWWLLLRQFKPRLCLEIGVYRGQVISLWAMIAQMLDFPCEVHGISPFSPLGDAVSVYRQDIDYLTDTLQSFHYLKLPAPTLIRALSSDPLAIEHIASQRWDLIYIDGGHDYEVALADYQLCSAHLAPGGLLVMDDSSLGTSYNPPLFSFAGYPGPSRVVAELAMHELTFLGAVGHNNVFQKEE
jgi:hypothetical protein